MKTISYLPLSFACFTLGTLFLAYYQGWIIMRYPAQKTEVAQTSASFRARKKKVNLIFWYHDKWNIETVDILETNDQAQTLQHLINSWLTLLDEEQIMSKKVTLQSASLDTTAYLSFDRNPFDEQSTTHQKWLWVESLLKTIRDNDITVQNIRFLVHHQIMQDNHLDFSNPWPITGFLTTQN